MTPYPYIKRGLDIALSLLGLAALAPLFLLVALLIKLDSGGPVFFLQRRAGKDGKAFTMYKFRSMIPGAEELRESLAPLNTRDGPAFKLKNDPRVTKTGVVLRKTCIDELPQLFNVLLGDMSLVGPRPLPLYEAALLTPAQKRRQEALPGLTCYWQLSDRKMSFDEWAALDLKYIEERGALVDIKLIVKTFGVVIKRLGDG